MYQKRGESTMNLKKITSLFLVCSMVGASSAFCFAETANSKKSIEEQLMKCRGSKNCEIVVIAEDDIKACKLGEGATFTRCEFNKTDGSKVIIHKCNDENALWENGKQKFYVHEGDKLLVCGDVKGNEDILFDPKDRKMTKEKFEAIVGKYKTFPTFYTNYYINLKKFDDIYKSISKSKDKSSSIKYPIIAMILLGLGYIKYKVNMIKRKSMKTD